MGRRCSVLTVLCLASGVVSELWGPPVEPFPGHRTSPPAASVVQEPLSQPVNRVTEKQTSYNLKKRSPSDNPNPNNHFYSGILDLQKYGSFEIPHSSKHDSPQNDPFQSILVLLNYFAQKEKKSLAHRLHSENSSPIPDVEMPNATIQNPILHNSNSTEVNAKNLHHIDSLELDRSVNKEKGINERKPKTKKADLNAEKELIIGAKYDNPVVSKDDMASITGSKFDLPKDRDTPQVVNKSVNMGSLKEATDDIHEKEAVENQQSKIPNITYKSENSYAHDKDETKTPVIYIGAIVQNPAKEKQSNNTKNITVHKLPPLNKGMLSKVEETEHGHRYVNAKEANINGSVRNKSSMVEVAGLAEA